MIQTQHDTIYACEIKPQRTAIGMAVVEQMQEKLAHLNYLNIFQNGLC